MTDAHVEYLERYGRELAKAALKYGDEALEPAGHPGKDIIDYTINEMVGLERYTQMIAERLTRLIAADPALEEAIGPGVNRVNALRRVGRQSALELIALRQALLDAGVDLGEPEQR